MTPYVPQAIGCSNKTCSRSPFFFSARCLAGLSGIFQLKANLSHTWLVWSRPIKCRPLGLVALADGKSARAPTGAQELELHVTHFIPNNRPADLPVCQGFDCILSTGAQVETSGFILQNTFFLHRSCGGEKSPRRSFDHSRRRNRPSGNTLSAHLHAEFFSHVLSQQTFCTLPVFLPALDCAVSSLQVPADACARAPLLSVSLSEPACGEQV